MRQVLCPVLVGREEEVQVLLDGRGGRVAIGVWADPARCETEVLFERIRALAPAPAGAHAPLAISTPGVVEELLAGEEIVRDTFVEVLSQFRQPDGSCRQENVFRYIIAGNPDSARVTRVH
jgi:hypothetical protein